MNSDFFKPLSQKPEHVGVLWRIMKSTCIAGQYEPPNHAPLESQREPISKRYIAAFDLVRL